MMKPLVNLALRTEFSFRQTFGHISEILKHENGTGHIGVADFNNTYAHIYLEKMCKEKGLNPIFGVRLEVVNGARKKIRGKCGPFYLFIAKNNDGLSEINRLTTTAWDNFYYKPMLDWSDLQSISNNVFVISDNFEDEDLRLDYLALTPSTPRMLLNFDIPKVYINNNFFSTPDDRKVYQLITGVQKRGDEYYSKFETKRAFQHVLSAEEFFRIYKDESALENSYLIAEQCKARLPKAPMAKYNGRMCLETECERGAKRKGININSGVYADRYNREIEIIKQKDYVDYFLIVADMIRKAKKTMLVGPARGSSAGSLVCYLLGITEVDPIKYNLVFERFIDIGREDLPDIDIDFPDEKRQDVIKNLFKTYGKDNVCHISNINRLKARSALDDVGLALRIPKYELEDLKDSIVDRSGGDARAAVSIQDTLETTEIGKAFTDKYPQIKLAERIQNHASHAGKHAAGVIVCNVPITNFGAINSREGSVMMDKNGAEYVNLLKIDVLGLRTLTILQECAEMVGMDYKKFYNLPLDDKQAFEIFNQKRFNGIFQFEGQALRMLCTKMGVQSFDDIAAITALARPGPLHSGGAEKFVKRRIGEEETIYISSHKSFIENTKDTYGIIVYQEQLMNICRDCARMTQIEVSEIRKATSKTFGKEYLDRYRKSFIKGTSENGIPEKEAIDMWDSMMTFGSWAMNKSHTVSYALISYWCAYMKAHYPLEFTVANLRHSRSESSALKILRDAVENDGIEYIPIDPDNSGVDWEVVDGKVVGGLINIKGIGERKAKEILLAREGKRKWSPSLIRALMAPETPFDSLYPCRDRWGDIYDNPREYGLAFPPTYISDISEPGTYVAIGKVIRKDVRDLNEYNELVKRGGKRYPDGENLSLKLTIEDDTGQINASISRKNYIPLNGPHLADTLIVDESWVIVKGRLSDGWRVLHIEHIFDLKELEDD